MSRTGEEDNEASLADISTEASMDKLETRIIERILARMEQPKGPVKPGESSRAGQTTPKVGESSSAPG